jgi:hypothetical protein
VGGSSDGRADSEDSGALGKTSSGVALRALMDAAHEYECAIAALGAMRESGMLSRSEFRYQMCESRKELDLVRADCCTGRLNRCSAFNPEVSK